MDWVLGVVSLVLDCTKVFGLHAVCPAHSAFSAIPVIQEEMCMEILQRIWIILCEPREYILSGHCVTESISFSYNTFLHCSAGWFMLAVLFSMDVEALDRRCHV